ncbi:MAG: hypothetical protein ACYDEV_04400 [Acidiferrobacter sp.]
MNKQELVTMIRDAGITECTGHDNILPSAWVYTSLSFDKSGEVESFEMNNRFSDEVVACVIYTRGDKRGEWCGDAISRDESTDPDMVSSCFSTFEDAFNAAMGDAESECDRLSDNAANGTMGDENEVEG